MDGKGSFSSDHINTSVYNNPKDSDIILRCGDHQLYAHRAILRMWSPFFERSLSSGFSVAKNAIFDIDHDDENDHEYLAAMLKHIYGMPFGDHSKNDPYEFDFCSLVMENIIKVYMMADKYDIPAVREAAISELQRFLHTDEALPDHFDAEYEKVPDWIAKVCGPDAPQLADPTLRDVLRLWLSHKFDVLIRDPVYIAKFTDGSLLDSEMTTELLSHLGTEIRHLKKKKT
ncbi:hypothetical protein KCU95_g3288, partial [Aureobasidium melanogenum]